MRNPSRSARMLVTSRRSSGNDLILATILAFIAGAANAGGFFALGQYTSHMTGYLSFLADNIAIANLWIAAVSALAIGAFVVGAGFSAILINWARNHAVRQQYALPIAVQGGFLACFAAGGLLSGEVGRLFALACLCFIMGMQNATITKISGARIRTTHATGMVTDIGIELGRAVYGRLRPGDAVAADRIKLRILLQLVGAFLLGGVLGAIGYGMVGFLFSLPLAAVLLALGLPDMIGHFSRASRP
ncbi:MAG: YoaK family protein [Paracoccus hibiscisoli]|uniref:YoaK family protein n=1 Tax=Paracoccus hibiscisoli TaxID=2023261 RepID=UPI00391C24BA